MCAHTLSNSDRQNIREVFLELDRDASGTLTLEELREIMVGEQHMSEAEFRRVFDAMDFNGDGEIRYSDFLAAFCMLSIKLDEQHLRDAFDRFDIDRTGYISKKNLKDVLGGQGLVVVLCPECTHSTAKHSKEVSRQEFAQNSLGFCLLKA